MNIYKSLAISLFIILTACKEKTAEKENVKQTKYQSTENAEREAANGLVQKHQTFNENIEAPDILKSFIPEGYSVIKLSSGDANLDGLDDKILVLRNNTEETTSNAPDGKPDKRPLLLLIAQTDSTYKLVYRNDNAVNCIDCAGLFGDPFTGITIKNGYFSIEHGIAGGQHWEQVTTFKYDKTQNNWFLHKDHYVSYKFNNSNDPDAEVLVINHDKLKTVKDFGQVQFEKYNLYNDKGY